MADPFAVGMAPPESAPGTGFGGISTDQWRNLALFGAHLATAANARGPGGFLTYGSGLAGPLGAATTGTMQSAQEQAKLRSGLALQGQQLETSKLGNELTRMQIPLMQQKLEAAREFSNDPLGASNASIAGPGGAGVSRGTDVPLTDRQNNPGALRFAGQPGATNVNGFAQFPTRDAGLAAADANLAGYADRGVTTLAQAITRWAPPTENNTAAYIARVAQASGIDPNAPIDLKDPGTRAKILPHMFAVEGGPRSVAGAPQSPPTAPAGPGLPPPVGGAVAGPDPALMAQAQAITRRAQRGRIAGYDTGPMEKEADRLYTAAWAGPIAAAQAAGAMPYNIETKLAETGFKRNPDGSVSPIPGSVADPKYIGQTARAKARNTTIDLHSGGMALVPNETGGFDSLKNPEVRDTMQPDGSVVPMHVVPASPLAPPGTPGEAAPIVGTDGKPIIRTLPAHITEARKETTQSFFGKEQDAFKSAQNAQGWLTQINHAGDVLNSSGGWYSTGPLAPERLALAQTWNDVSRTLGLKAPLNEKALAMGEELVKSTITAGFELASHYEGHARQAASTIMNATKAVPGVENSPQGLRIVSAGINEGAQNAIDLHNFKQDVWNRTKDLTTAETEFASRYPPAMYARRAISTMRPETLREEKDMMRLLPGTYFLFDGRLKQVPERAGAPPIPDYLRPQTAGH